MTNGLTFSHFSTKLSIMPLFLATHSDLLTDKTNPNSMEKLIASTHVERARKFFSRSLSQLIYDQTNEIICLAKRNK